MPECGHKCTGISYGQAQDMVNRAEDKHNEESGRANEPQEDISAAPSGTVNFRIPDPARNMTPKERIEYQKKLKIEEQLRAEEMKIRARERTAFLEEERANLPEHLHDLPLSEVPAVKGFSKAGEPHSFGKKCKYIGKAVTSL